MVPAMSLELPATGCSPAQITCTIELTALCLFAALLAMIYSKQVSNVTLATQYKCWAQGQIR